MVSVIIPTYNHRDFVAETLESVLAQTFTDYEVIVVNDGSPDDTAHVLRPYIDSGRIRYIEQKNAGQAAARNRGLAEAKGEFIAFLDDDDVWPPDKLDWQVAVMRGEPALVVIGGLTGFIHDSACVSPSEVQDEKRQEMSLVDIFCGNPFQSPGQTLIRASALRQIGGFDERVWGADDHDLYIRLASMGTAIKLRRTALYYRLHAENASRATARLYWNALGVLRKNAPLIAPKYRLDARRSAYRWLFYILGQKALREGSPFDAALLAASMFPVAIGDQLLLKKILLELLPKAMRLRLRPNSE